VLTARIRQLRESPLAMRLTRYTLGSVVALATSIVVFALLYAAGVGTTAASVSAFLAGAIPNWVLNRRWAWNVRGRVQIGREVIGYAAISALALLASSAGTAWAHQAVRGMSGHGLRVALVTLAYVVVQVLLFGVKFLAYDLWVFSGRSRIRAAFRSRHQVWVAARANRMP
jgi:putative flippase GtrA